MAKLTAKEENSARFIAFEGYTQHYAYLTTYDVTTRNQNTIDSNVSKLTNSTNVAQRFTGLEKRVRGPIRP
jgi:hypothetical protein